MGADAEVSAFDAEAAMTRDELLKYCLAKLAAKIVAFLGSDAAGSDPAGSDTAGSDTAGSGGAGSGGGWAGGATVGLKCGSTRQVADEWLLRYPQDASVMPYIGRSGWNTLRTGGGIPDDEVFEAIDISYDAVVAKLPKKDRPGSA
jgi:hypothetical protein